MPPGYYILCLCILAVSMVKARKSQDPEWSFSNTMSRELGEKHDAVRYSPSDTIDIDNNQGLPYDGPMSDWPASGRGPYNDGISSGADWRDDEDDYDDESDVSSGFEDTHAVLPPEKRPGAGGSPKVVEPSTDPDKPVVEPPVNKLPDDDMEVLEKPKGEPEDTGNVEIKEAPEGEDDMNGGEAGSDPKRDHHSRSSIIGTPGLLPGIIGGAVVGLLCAVLLVMFIVYRMRKKDEGSYALEEPKMTSPSRGYTRAPTKEYWA